jgi:hypothetical protein
MDIDTWPIGHMPVVMHNPEIAIMQHLIWLFGSRFSMGIINPVVLPELASATPLVQSMIAKSLRRCRGVLARTEPPGEAGVQRAKLDDEIRCHKQSAQSEGHVSGKPHPLPENRTLIECAAASIRKPVLVDRIQLRPADREKFSSIQRTSPPL